MKPLLQDSTPKTWFLSGLTIMMLMAGVLLEEGQARTYSASTGHSSVQTQRLSRPLPSSLESGKAIKRATLRASSERKPTKPSIQKEGTDQNPGKKRMGLAILFLGILAEEG